MSRQLAAKVQALGEKENTIQMNDSAVNSSSNSGSVEEDEEDDDDDNDDDDDDGEKMEVEEDPSMGYGNPFGLLDPTLVAKLSAKDLDTESINTADILSGSDDDDDSDGDEGDTSVFSIDGLGAIAAGNLTYDQDDLILSSAS